MLTDENVKYHFKVLENCRYGSFDLLSIIMYVLYKKIRCIKFEEMPY